MKEKKRRINIKAGSIITALISSIIVGLLVLSMSITEDVIIEKEEVIRTWTFIADSLGDEAGLDNATYESGILSIYFPLHDATPDTTYLENDSDVLEAMCIDNGTGYVNTDDFRLEMPHSTAFDIVVRVRANKTVCWNGSAFIDAYARVNITSPGFSIPTLTNMTPVISRNDTGQEYIWINFYINNAGSGYTITRGNETQIPTIIYEGYY